MSRCIVRLRGDLTDPTFNIAGWKSSYTRERIPEAEMRDWLKDTVERISELGAERVLEIGCGTGMLLFRIAPRCIEYRATDDFERGAGLREAAY